MKITILGCGPSQGVPVIGQNWGDCNPKNPKNRRSRPSISIEKNGKNILIDTSPDIRTQLLDNNIKEVHAVLYTHLHYDHVGGIGELRTLSYLAKRRIGVFSTGEILKELKKNWSYLFVESNNFESQLYKPVADLNQIEYGKFFSTHGIQIFPFKQDHGVCETVGFRLGDFAYSTDVVNLDEKAFSALDGIKVWVVDCLREAPHPTHSHFDRTISWIQRLKPERTILTHMNFQADYEQLKARCPKGVEPGYDGLILEIN